MKAARFIARPVPSRCSIRPGAAALRPRCDAAGARELSRHVPGSHAPEPRSIAVLSQQRCLATPVTTLLLRARLPPRTRASGSDARGEAMPGRAPRQRWPRPWGGEEPRGPSGLSEQALLSPRARATPAGADPTLPPTQLRQSGRRKGTGAISPPGPGPLLFVPKDIHAAVTTICSLAEHKPARAPVQLHRPERTQAGGSPTAPGTPQSRSSEACPAPHSHPFGRPCFGRRGVTRSPQFLPVPSSAARRSPLGAVPGGVAEEGQAAASLGSRAPSSRRSLNAFLGQGLGD